MFSTTWKGILVTYVTSFGGVLEFSQLTQTPWDSKIASLQMSHPHSRPLPWTWAQFVAEDPSLD